MFIPINIYREKLKLRWNIFRWYRFKFVEMMILKSRVCSNHDSRIRIGPLNQSFRTDATLVRATSDSVQRISQNHSLGKQGHNWEGVSISVHGVCIQTNPYEILFEINFVYRVFQNIMITALSWFHTFNVSNIKLMFFCVNRIDWINLTLTIN